MSRFALRARFGVRARAAAAVLTVFVCALVLGSASPARALTLPTPLAFVSNLDLECYQTDSYTPAVPPILTHHLNPVLSGLPDEKMSEAG